MRIAAVSGAIMVILMWSASLPPQDDVFMDNHIIYALILIGLALVSAGNTFGLGRWCGRRPRWCAAFLGSPEVMERE